MRTQESKGFPPRKTELGMTRGENQAGAQTRSPKRLTMTGQGARAKPEGAEASQASYQFSKDKQNSNTFPATEKEQEKVMGGRRKGGDWEEEQLGRGPGRGQRGLCRLLKRMGPRKIIRRHIF